MESVGCAVTLEAHAGAVHCLQFSSNGTYCVSGGADRSLALYNPTRALELKRYIGHGYPVYDLCLSSDDAKLLSGGGDKLAYLWDVMSGAVERKFGGTRAGGHTQRINAVAFSGSAPAQLALTASYDATVRVWDMRASTLDPIQVLDQASDSVSELVVLDTQIYAASVDGKLRCYDARNGQLIDDDAEAPIGAAAVSNDGNCCLLACLDSSLRLLDRSSGEILAVYRGHQNADFKLSPTLSCDDAYVLVGSEDGSLFAWDIVDGSLAEPAKVWSKLHRSALSCVVAHPTEPGTFLCASHDGSIKLLSANTKS